MTVPWGSIFFGAFDPLGACFAVLLFTTPNGSDSLWFHFFAAPSYILAFT
jgi:hypothetical protein